MGFEERKVFDSDWSASIGFIFHQTLAKPYDFIIGITDRLIKFYHRIVGCSNLEINLWTPFGPDASFNFLHYAATISLSPVCRVYGKVIYPTAVSFIPSHDRGDDLSIYNSNQKKVSTYM